MMISANTRRWQKPAYILGVLGHRTVPVEVGKHYLHADWTQDLVTFSTFLREQMLGQPAGSACTDGLPPSKPIAYLAQHPLFQQVPRLKQDILVRSRRMHASAGERP